MLSKEAYYARVLRNRALAADESVTRCPCLNTLCEWHGQCRACVALHRHHNDHLPVCLQPIIKRALGVLAGVAESTVAGKEGTPVAYRHYVRDMDRAGRTAGAIHPMTLADIPAGRALWDQTPGMGLRSLDDTEDGIARFLARNPSTCFIALDSAGALVGTVLCGHDGRRGTIYHACVAAAHRDKGLGRTLVAAALDALRREGIHKAALVCFAANTGGAAFWHALGWTARDDLLYFDQSLSPDNV